MQNLKDKIKHDMNKKNQSMIPGASLASTIKVLAGLGPLGEKVLKQNGISEIDPKKKLSKFNSIKNIRGGKKKIWN